MHAIFHSNILFSMAVKFHGVDEVDTHLDDVNSAALASCDINVDIAGL